MASPLWGQKPAWASGSENVFLPQKADILFGGESQHAPQHAEVRQPLDFAVARPSAKIIEMSASRRRH